MAETKTVVITGATGGIGKTLTEGFLKNGFKVIMLSRNAEKLEAVKEEFSNLGEISCIQADVSKYEEVKRAFSQIGELNVLVNCAGVLGPVEKLENSNMQKWLETVEINLAGTAYCCREAIPLLRKSNSRGKIINLAGGGSAYPREYHSAYGVSKAAVVRLTDTLAKELGSGVDVNIVAPGAHKTKMWEEETHDKPPDKWADPKRLVDTILFLASEKSDGITGKFIHIYDKWENFDPSISKSELYTLRRLEP